MFGLSGHNCSSVSPLSSPLACCPLEHRWWSVTVCVSEHMLYMCINVCEDMYLHNCVHSYAVTHNTVNVFPWNWCIWSWVSEHVAHIVCASCEGMSNGMYMYMCVHCTHNTTNSWNLYILVPINYTHCLNSTAKIIIEKSFVYHVQVWFKELSLSLYQLLYYITASQL